MILNILIVLYNKKPFNSETLINLSKFNLSKFNIKLTIWNNGPNPLFEDDLFFLDSIGFKYEIIETINNTSLSVIYNHFILTQEGDLFAIFDDDSCISQEYLSDILNSNDLMLGIPLLTSKGKACSPSVNGVLVDRKLLLNKSDNVYAITSGVVLSRKFVKKIQRYYEKPFDERFYLYGIDTTFFRRVNKLDISFEITILNGFKHSLSCDLDEGKEMSKFRIDENSISEGLYCKYYFPLWKGIIILIRTGFDIFKGKSKISFKRLFFTFLTGKSNINNFNVKIN